MLHFSKQAYISPTPESGFRRLAKNIPLVAADLGLRIIILLSCSLDCVAQVPIVEVVRWGTLLVNGGSSRWQALVLLWSTQAVAAEPRHAAQVGGLQGGTVALAFTAAGLL